MSRWTWATTAEHQMETKETEISQLVKILEILFPQDG
jgi:hypothetical protein